MGSGRWIERVRGWCWGALLLAPLLACGGNDTGIDQPPLAPGGAGGAPELPPPVIHAPPSGLAVELLGPELGAPRNVYDLSLDAGGGLWIAAREGVFVRPPGAHFFDLLTTEDGMPRAVAQRVGGLDAGMAVVSFEGNEPPRLVRLLPGGGAAAEPLDLATMVGRIRTLETESGPMALVAGASGLVLLDGDGIERGRRVLPGPVHPALDVALTEAGDAWVGDLGRVARITGPVVQSMAGRVESSDLPGAEEGQVVAVEVCPDGSVWASSLGHGLFHLSAGGEVRGQLTREEVLPQDHVPTLACDLDGSLWVGTSWGGLVRLAPDGSARYHNASAGLPGDSIRRLLVVPDGNGRRTLWIATDGGAAFYEGD